MMRTFTLDFRKPIGDPNGPPVLFSGREAHKERVLPSRIPHQFLEWALTKDNGRGYRSEATWDEILNCGDQPEVKRVTVVASHRVLVTVERCGCNIGGF